MTFVVGDFGQCPGSNQQIIDVGGEVVNVEQEFGQGVSSVLVDEQEVGCVDEKRQVKPGQNPIVQRILENVEKGHSGSTELVHIQSLVLAFGKMQQHHDVSQGLRLGVHTGPLGEN